MTELFREVTFDASTSEADRTIEFGNITTNVFNKVAVSVVDSAGDEVPGTVAGVVSLSIRSPGADRFEDSTNTLDLSTDARTFTPFEDIVQAARFSVTGLAGGNMVVAKYYKINP